MGHQSRCATRHFHPRDAKARVHNNSYPDVHNSIIIHHSQKLHQQVKRKKT